MKEARPSGNKKVNRVNEICAEFVDILNTDYIEGNFGGMPLTHNLYKQLIKEVLAVHKNAIKILTIKK